ncbi:conserved hypothetical protein [Histoplasma capsulatum var. duboisii H88]|uniref:F-box domain-containing protein n=2 Tax=Ajellomyces capsulatus TaxID=5037 RepID=F0U8D4_AJEC8|nr:conserved hypothetical protein [Histoplasma capsulatum H143]EGC40892.1 conserved hypothetical protein [Histoplasma capsulatum var. duboisii H88]
MNAVASRHSSFTGVACDGDDSYRGVASSRQAPVYPAPMQSRSPSPGASSTQSMRNNNYPNAGIYSPTAAAPSGSFIFRSFKPANSGSKEPFLCSRSLPQEVYDCILSHLQCSHLAPHCQGCITCYMRDLYSLALTSRAWEKAVRGKLYNKIYIQGNDSPAQLKKYKWKRGSRLRLLRRSLRERKLLANAVFELRVPDLETAMGGNGKQSITAQEYRDLVASVVMVCPNLERLVGLSLPYNHEFDRLTHALSTRKKLKEHAWIFAGNPGTGERSKNQSAQILDNEQVFQFLNYHASWSNLDTLMVHSLDSSGVVGHGIFLRILNFLPSLRHLTVCGFQADDFTHRTLLFLPQLISLRLENLPGLTQHGLAHYSTRPEARALKSLTLVELNISSLLIISKILASLRRLERFSIVQTKTVPILSDGGMIFQPLLASSTLKHLHWDVACSDTNGSLTDFHSFPPLSSLSKSNTANSHLAQSILNSGFPCLESLRAPHDVEPLGALQAVCRPARNGQIMVPADRYSLPRSSHGSIPKRPLALPSGNNLTSARIRGQTLIDKAAKSNETGIRVVVSDHSGAFKLPTPCTFSDLTSEPGPGDTYDVLAPSTNKEFIPSSERDSHGITVHEFTIPLCIGRVCTSSSTTVAAPPPRFILTPDIPGSDADGGLISWRHYLSSNQTPAYLTAAGTNAAASSPSSTDRRNTGSSMNDDTSTPSSSPSSSLFSSWGTGGSSGHNNSNHKLRQPLSPRTPDPLSPTLQMSGSQTTTGIGVGSGAWSGQPFWTTRETCDGSWNRRHKLGKDWWWHVERDRPLTNNASADIVRLEQLF